MTILLDNALGGTDGAQVSDATLAASATTGTLTIAAPGTRATYDTTHTVHGQPMLRIDTGHHRAGTTTALGTATPRLIGPTLGSVWAVRVYMRSASLYAAGHGTAEVRWHFRVGDTGVILSEQSSGTAVNRLQDADLAAPSATASASGASIMLADLMRLELACDGVDTRYRLYSGHDTVSVREGLWAGRTSAGALSVSGFRYRIRPTLRLGDQGTDVADLQQELIDLGYDLGAWGADGDYGTATQDAVMACQSDYGTAPVDGEAGPETRATIDLALGTVPPPLYLSYLAASDGAWIGPAEAPVTPTVTPRLVLGTPI